MSPDLHAISGFGAEPGQDDPIAKLILINGPPGVGKSALAHRYAAEHPLTLHLEIDAIRVSLGGWEELDESRLIARSLALAMAEAHLRDGHDVIVPQYVGRIEFISALEDLARRLRVDFVEVLLMDTEAAVVERFRTRRVDLSLAGRPHPQADVDETSVAEAIAESFQRLRAVQTERNPTFVITAADGQESSYRALCLALGEDATA